MSTSAAPRTGFQRPELVCSSPQFGDQDSRILAALENEHSNARGGSKRPLTRGFRRAVMQASLALIGVGVLWGVNQLVLPATEYLTKSAPQDAEKTHEPVPVAAPTQSTATSPLSPAAETQGDGAAQLSETPDPDEVLLAALTAPATGKLASPTSGSEKAAPKAQSAENRPALLKAMKGEDSSTLKTASAQGKAMVKKDKSDSDVALLTELVATVHTPPAPRQQKSPPTKSAAKSPATNRDVVLPNPGDSTQSLLARCAKLGFLEGQLCRWRICSGHESNPLCQPQTN